MSDSAELTMAHQEYGEFPLDSLRKLWEDQCLCDVIFKSKDMEVYAHRIIIAAWSPSLKVQFEEQFSENLKSPKLELHQIVHQDLDRESFGCESLLAVVKFMYGENLNISKENYVNILTVAKVLDLPAIVKLCEEFTQKHLQENQAQNIVSSSGNLLPQSTAIDSVKNKQIELQNVHKLPGISDIFFSDNSTPNEHRIHPIVPITCSNTSTLDSSNLHMTSKYSGNFCVGPNQNCCDQAQGQDNLAPQNEDHETNSKCANSSLISNGEKSSFLIENTPPSKRKRGRPKKSQSLDSGNSSFGATEKNKKTRNSSTKRCSSKSDNKRRGNTEKKVLKCVRPSAIEDTNSPETKTPKLRMQKVSRSPQKILTGKNKDVQEKNIVDSECSIPVKKRKLRELTLRSQSSHKKLQKKQIHEKEDCDNAGCDTDNDDNDNGSNCDIDNDNDTDKNEEITAKNPAKNHENLIIGSDVQHERKVGGPIPEKNTKKRRLRIYEKQATMYDLSFERFEKYFVDLYELLRCHRCSTEFKDRAALYIHVDDCNVTNVKTIAPVLPMYCSQCDIDFNSTDDLMQHRFEYHSGRRPGSQKAEKFGTQQCQFCDHSYKTSKMLEQHLLKIHNFYDLNTSKHRLLQCKKKGCKFMVIRVDAMYTHYKRHNSTNKFRVQCPLCNVSYLRVKWLEGHMQREHSTTDGGIAPVVHNVKNKEIEGQKERGVLDTIVEHVEEDSSPEKTDRKKVFTFECKHCSYKAKKKIALQKHMMGLHREHCTEDLISRLLRCPHEDCNQEFVEHKALKSHLSSVHGHRSKIHICGECSAEFTSSSSLCGHMRQHKERSIVCPYEGCTYKTHTNLHLKTHIKHKHLGEEGRDHLCHLCGYRCHSQGNLKLHLMNRHHMDLRFRRIRKRGQQMYNVKNGGKTSKSSNGTDLSNQELSNVNKNTTNNYTPPTSSTLPHNSIPQENEEISCISLALTSTVQSVNATQESLIYLQDQGQSSNYLEKDNGQGHSDSHSIKEHMTVSQTVQSDYCGPTTMSVVKNCHSHGSHSQNNQKTTTLRENIVVPTASPSATPIHDAVHRTQFNHDNVRNSTQSYYINQSNSWQCQHGQVAYSSHYVQNIHPHLLSNLQSDLQVNSAQNIHQNLRQASMYTPSTINSEQYASLMTQNQLENSRNLDAQILMPHI